VVAPRPTAALPHVSATGDATRAVVRAIDAILAAQTPPVARGTALYETAELDCGDVSSPMGGGYQCSFDLRVDGGTVVSVKLTAPSSLAKNLFDALAAAGTKECSDLAHGDFLRLANVKIALPSSTLDLDDGSSYAIPPAPNVTVDGKAASDLLAAMQTAAMTDCDAASRPFLVCNTAGGAPACGFMLRSLDDVGSSKLLYTCNPRGTGAPKQLATADSARLWSAILAAASAGGYKPLNGTVAQATVVNASYFQYDGKQLGFTLTMDDATPPGPAGP
jgi:hypothetical protein